MSISVDIEKKLGSFHLRVAFEAENETMALLGASGCGKSMTLRCIAGIVRPDRGRIVLNGRTLFDSEQHIALPPQQRGVGYLFQQYALFPHMTVEKNVCAGTREGTRAERKAAAQRILRTLGLEELAQRLPANLSGGQQQRAALARILVGKPEILLLDEPFSALDEHIKWKIELELADTLRSFPGGVLFVSHSRDEIYRLCDTVCVLNEGKSDPKTTVAELFHAPLTVGAARISGCKNISRAEAGAGGTLYCADWGVSLKTALPLRENTAYAGIRAHYFTLSGTENPITCTVERVIPNPFSVVYMLKTPGGALLRMESEKAEALHTGDTITLHIAPEDVMPLTE